MKSITIPACFHSPNRNTATAGGMTNRPTSQSATARLITKQLVTVRSRRVVNTDKITKVFPITVNTINIQNIEARKPCSREMGGRVGGGGDGGNTDDVSLVDADAIRALLLVLLSSWASRGTSPGGSWRPPPPPPPGAEVTPAINGIADKLTFNDVGITTSSLDCCDSFAFLACCDPPSTSRPSSSTTEFVKFEGLSIEFRRAEVAAGGVWVAPVAGTDIPTTNCGLIANVTAVSDRMREGHEGGECFLKLSTVMMIPSVDVVRSQREEVQEEGVDHHRSC